MITKPGEQEMDVRTLEAQGHLWRCPRCGTRWAGFAAEERHCPKCGESEIADP